MKTKFKPFVITIKGHKESEAAARRCIDSGVRFGYDVKTFLATTPDNVDETMRSFKIPTKPFEDNRYSRVQNVKSCFMSHYRLWDYALKSNEVIMVLEHDAVFVTPLPEVIHHSGCISVGKPSYGKFNIPTTIGVNPLMSKPYFPGAHAYIITPQAAKVITEKAAVSPAPADLFLNISNFPWLQELYPWCVEVKDEFSTVQMKEGCFAKHNYSTNYQLLDA